MQIKTERLLLREYTPADEQAYLAYQADPRYTEFYGGSCGLRLKGRVAGTAEFGLQLGAESWGRGYATEAARALLGFGFRDLRLAAVRGESVSANVRVVALARRIGLVEIGTHTGPAWMNARGWHRTEWQLTRELWERMAAV